MGNMKARLLMILLLTGMTACRAWSQATVTSMKETIDFIAGDDQRRDLNGQLCALVKVQVIDEITDVEGNVMGDIVSHGVEKWVYLAQGSRNMKIHFKNNLPLRVVFKDYEIPSLKSNRVYELVIQVPNTWNKPEDQTAVREEQQVVHETVAPTTERTDNTQQNTPAPASVRKAKPKSAVAFGIRGGLNLTSTQFEKGYDDVSMTASFHLGVVVDVPLSDTFFFTPGLYFSGKGYKYDDGKNVENGSAQYIDVPILASLHLGDAGKAQFQVGAGPYIALGVGGKIENEKKSTDVKFFDYYDGFDYGLAVSAGVLIGGHFHLGVSGQIGFGNYRNRTIGLGIGYNF